MTLQSKRKTIGLTRFILTPILLILASGSAAAQTNTFPTTGNAGAGTTSPARKLEVVDSANPQLRLTHTDGSAYTDFQTLSSGNLIIPLRAPTQLARSRLRYQPAPMPLGSTQPRTQTCGGH